MDNGVGIVSTVGSVANGSRRKYLVWCPSPHAASSSSSLSYLGTSSCPWTHGYFEVGLYINNDYVAT
jgi:hypothetical protein